MAKTILLADDSVTIQKVVELTFMDEGYQVVAVSDGNAALEKLPELKPDLLIADIHMPGADGYEVCRRAKETYPDVPVLLLVGTFEQFDEQQAAAAGADANLKKPFDSQELLGQVEALTSAAAPEEPATAETAALKTVPPPLEEEGGEPALEATWGVAEPAEEPPAESAATMPFPLAQPPAAEEPPPAEALAEPPAEEPPRAEAVGEVPAGEPAAEEAVPAEEAPAEPAAPVAEAAEAVPAREGDGHIALSDGDVDRIARRVAELVGKDTLREVAWDVFPDLAEVVIKERIRELESQVE